MPLIVVIPGFPITDEDLKYELFGMWNLNTIPVDATPTDVVETPTILPKSPLRRVVSLIS